MIYSMFFEKLYSLTTNDESLHQTLPNHLTCLMDEFANVTLPGDFVGLSSTMRSRGLSVIIIIQNLHQYKEKFPNNDQDKNLRANMCTTIILGGPDNDSCKTLSEEFGNMTIHKQTSGTSYGQSSSTSRNEDVMERALLPAQEIHEMDKDGPCAIKIKGAGKLWVSKVRFEDSPLLPLLTRKKAYQIKTFNTSEQKVFDEKKSYLEQLPDISFGTAASNFVDECKDNDIGIMEVDNFKISMLGILQMNEVEVPGEDGSTQTFWNRVTDTTNEMLIEKQKNELNLDDFLGEEILIVQQLRNNHFTGAQINALASLIHKKYSYESITKYFNNEMSVEDINKFTTKLSTLKQANL